VRVDVPDDARDALASLGDQLGAPMLVRMLESLGQAVVDMRGTDAADPRLVVEIALVRLARREAGTPLQALAERVDRLERGAGSTSRDISAPVPTTPTASANRGDPEPSPEGGRARSGRSFAELRRAREGAAPASAAPGPAAAEPWPAAAPPEAAAEAEAGPDIDIDDVILAWPEVLDGLPPATKAAVREAQPISLADGVITFGVPRAQFEVAVPRFRKEADNIRAALSAKLGQRLMFKPVPHDFGGSAASSAAPPDDAPPPDDDEIDLDDLVDDTADAPVDSVSLITQSLGATVVEEVPRD
jgi:DNA polymerase-3 subunit gamma/tau